MAVKKIGRAKGRRTKGYFYREGRGWYTKDGGRFVPLRHQDGEHIKEADANARDVQEAHARFLLGKQQAAKVREHLTVFEICDRYLAHAKTNGAPKTHADRADTLFDFCFGLPPELRNKIGPPAFRNQGTKEPPPLTDTRKRELSKQKLHDGFGKLAVSDIRKHHVTDWLDAHSTWSQSGRRTRIQAVKRAFNFAVEEEIVKQNPVRGYKTPRSKGRVTYITPEQESALLEKANPALRIALTVCIRTGARFGSEFAKLSRRHVKDDGERMAWVFKAGEIKNRRERMIFITDPAIVELVRRQLRHFKGDEPLFRNATGGPWNKHTLSHAFRKVRNKLIRGGMAFDPDCCMYSSRHTYAKRVLQGYWTGKPTNIETLARLMGNTPQVCREHYLQWSELDNEMLWGAA